MPLGRGARHGVPDAVSGRESLLLRRDARLGGGAPQEMMEWILEQGRGMKSGKTTKNGGKFKIQGKISDVYMVYLLIQITLSLYISNS